MCVDRVTQCYFPGAIAPDDWASCTVETIVTKLPTCRFSFNVLRLMFIHSDHSTVPVSIKAIPATSLLHSPSGVPPPVPDHTTILGIALQQPQLVLPCLNRSHLRRIASILCYLQVSSIVSVVSFTEMHGSQTSALTHFPLPTSAFVYRARRFKIYLLHAQCVDQDFRPLFIKNFGSVPPVSLHPVLPALFQILSGAAVRPDAQTPLEVALTVRVA